MIIRPSAAIVILLCIAVENGFAEGQKRETAAKDFTYNEGAPGGNIVVVSPEVATPIEMSSSDMNRIQCSSEIKDVVFSKEKGITVKILGRNAFIKFLITKRGDKEAYSSTPTEIFVACEENIYNLITIPKRIPSQTVRLSAGVQRIKKNASLYAGMPFEKKVVSIIKSIYTDEIPDSFTVEQSGKRVDLFKAVDLTLLRTVTVEGEGLSVKEYRASLKRETKSNSVEISERDFLRAELTTRPASIMVDRLKLSKGDMARVLIVEITSAGLFKGDRVGEGK